MDIDYLRKSRTYTELELSKIVHYVRLGVAQDAISKGKKRRGVNCPNCIHNKKCHPKGCWSDDVCWKFTPEIEALINVPKGLL